MHIPVLLSETIEALGLRPGGRYVDGTLGGGGHSEAILSAIGPEGKLLGLDRDEAAIERCRKRLASFGERFTAIHSDFARIAEVVASADFGEVDGVLLDLGVSSFQLDEAERGFSFRADGPLDMRMDQSRGQTAAELIAAHSENARAVAQILRDFGEEPDAMRIAKAILTEQAREPIVSTLRLAQIVERAVGGRRGRVHHPATKTFQALRIAVNCEFDQISAGIENALRILAVGGHIAIITFHSLEDRIVKRAFAAHEGREEALQQGGSKWMGILPRIRRIGRKPTVPTDEECDRNPRARSAKLRAAIRIPDAA